MDDAPVPQALMRQPQMRRVLIVGAGGVGKSTLARELERRTGLPIVHLDREYWRPGWVATPDDEWRHRVGELIEADAWIMDGNYGGTMELRASACDTLIFLDLPTPRSLFGVVRRRSHSLRINSQNKSKSAAPPSTTVSPRFNPCRIW